MAIAETLVAKPPPLRLDEDGVLRVGSTRVPLDRVVAEFEGGASVEEIVAQFDTLRRSDVYAVISYYLDHHAEVEAYLEDRRRLAEEVRRENEARFPPEGRRERLRSRLRGVSTMNAPEQIELQRRVERKIAQATASHISNTKWRKLFRLLYSLEVRVVLWKFLRDDRVFCSPVPAPADLLETSLGDVLPYPYGPYREIEWIEVPRSYPDPRADENRPLPERTHELDGILEGIHHAGELPVTVLDSGLRIVGYTW
jgi:uncharacterized protein (DUF433 family)